MDKHTRMSYIIITGAAGFIASRFAQKLNSQGIDNLILVDDFSDNTKIHNWTGLKYFETSEIAFATYERSGFLLTSKGVGTQINTIVESLILE